MVEATTHLVTESGEGAVPLSMLTPSPGAILSLNGSTENAQDCNRNGMANPASVFSGAHVQGVMGAVLDAPIQTDQFQQPCGIGLIGRQAGDNPDCFDFLFAPFELTNAVNAGELMAMGKAHLLGRDFPNLDASPLDASVAHVESYHLRGKNPPAGGFGLGPITFSDCP